MRLRRRILDILVRVPLEATLLMVPLFLIKKYLLKPALARAPLSQTTAHLIQGLVTLGLLVGAYVLIVRLLERRPVAELSPVGAGREATLGWAGGVGMMSAIVCALWLTGAYSAATWTLTPKLIDTLVWLLVMATLEEMLFRGIAYRILEKNLGTLGALLLSAAIFGGMHITNDNANLVSVLSAALGGLFVALFYTLTGRLWLPIFFHYGWNLSQIFWGLPMSGTEEFGRFFDGRLEGPVWLTGGAFGPENSLITLAVSVALLAGCFARARRRGRLVPFAAAALSPPAPGSEIAPLEEGVPVRLEPGDRDAEDAGNVAVGGQEVVQRR